MTNSYRHLHDLALIIALSCLLTSCATNLTSRSRISEELPSGSTIALLPFEDLSGSERAGEKITDYFQMGLTTETRFRTLEFGTVYDQLRALRIRSATLLTTNQIDSLSAILDVDYILTGTVLEYEEITHSYLGTAPRISFNCRLIDCKSKQTVWVGVGAGAGESGELVFGIGAIRSSEKLAKHMVSSAVSEIRALFEK